MLEKDWSFGFLCRPNHKARFAAQEAGVPICPEPLKLWYPNESGRLDIRQCYNGEDCLPLTSTFGPPSFPALSRHAAGIP